MLGQGRSVFLGGIFVIPIPIVIPIPPKQLGFPVGREKICLWGWMDEFWSDVWVVVLLRPWKQGCGCVTPVYPVKITMDIIQVTDCHQPHGKPTWLARKWTLCRCISRERERLFPVASGSLTGGYLSWILMTFTSCCFRESWSKQWYWWSAAEPGMDVVPQKNPQGSPKSSEKSQISTVQVTKGQRHWFICWTKCWKRKCQKQWEFTRCRWFILLPSPTTVTILGLQSFRKGLLLEALFQGRYIAYDPKARSVSGCGHVYI